jgi:hypothetical protein
MCKALVEMSEDGSKLQYLNSDYHSFQRDLYIVYLFHDFYAFNELIVN